MTIESRTKKTIRNTFYSFSYQFIDIICTFILRTIFIRTLGKSYLGLSGLFTNILTVLSLMESGVGGAIVFALYKPLAEHDENKVAALMQLYKKVYSIIGLLVCVIGLSITPFLKYIINIPDKIDNIYLIYWLLIANTAISYFLTYRRSLLIADQRSDINIKNQIIFRIIRFILLSGALLIARNYIIYLSLDVLNTLFSNLQITYLIKRRYSNIEKAKPQHISSSEKKQITKYIYSGLFMKFGQTVVNCTDSIIVSAFVSTVSVGLFSNYSLITNSLDTAVYLVFSGTIASIGNFAVERNASDSESLFKKLNFSNFLIVFYCTVCLTSLLSPFVAIWAGVDYQLSNITVSVIILNFYIASSQKSIECFIGAVGEMGYRNRFRSLIEGIVNLVTSLLLVNYTNLGITGVFLGTTVCFIAGRIWMDARVLYKFWFKVNFLSYVIRYIVRFIITVVVALIGKKITSIIFQLFGTSLYTWILCGILLSVLSISIILLLYRKSEEFSYFKRLISQKINKSN